MTTGGPAPARALLADAARQLAAAGVATPRVDAELLLAALLDLPRGRLITLDVVPATVVTAFAAHVARRADREPLQHITGQAPFRHLLLDVGPGVFVPRPETELLVDAVLAGLRAIDSPLVLDLCAGSGALGLAVATEVPGARVVLVERSPHALPYLAANAARTDPARVQVVAGDIADHGLLAPWLGRADVVLSNPPYVPAALEVAPEVRADPGEAVFAGADGLELMPVVIECAAGLLRPGGVVAIEHDDTHERSVPGLVQGDGRFDAVVEHRDLAGRPRFVTARRCIEHRSLGQDVGRGTVL